MLPRIRTLGLLLVATACQTPAALTDADREAIGASLDAFAAAALAQDWGVITGMYTEDAVLMPPNAPAATGRAAIQEIWMAFPPLAEIRPEIIEIRGGGDLAYVRGSYTLAFAVEGIPADTGKFMEVRRRQADGTWLIVRDMFNSDLPIPGMEGPEGM